jgi:DNA-binding XRE family transcriptional regulator
VINVEDWAEIRRLHRAEGMPVRAIARKLRVGRNTVRRALAAEGPPRYVRPVKGSAADAAEPRIRELLAQWPDMPATVIAERIGWQRSLTVLKVRVRELRPLFAPPDPASRTEYLPGELAQCDLWFPPADVPLGAGQAGRPPVLEARRAFLIGHAVRERRLDLGLSQVELASRAGMTQPALSRLEAGGVIPTIPLLERISAALNADLIVEIAPHAA